jgi:putative ATP-binding cassette transporter
VKVADLILANMTVSPRRMIAIAALSGIANAAILGIINVASATAADRQTSVFLVFPLLGAILVYAASQKFVLVAAVREVERTVDVIRVRLFDLAATCELLNFEAMGHEAIYSAVATETQTISNTINVLITSAQAAILLAFAFIYLSVTSLPAFVIGIVMMALALTLLIRQSGRQLASFGQVFAQQAELLGVLGSLVAGFKEVRMNSARAQALSADFRARSRQSADQMIISRTAMADSINLSQILIFLMLGALVFAVPTLFPGEAKTVASSATIVLFMVGPLNTLVNALPTLSIANAAAEKVSAIETALRTGLGGEASNAEPFEDFDHLVLQDVRFTHSHIDGRGRFDIGPFNLTFRAGETVFITGGNGSGKTTLLRVLVGLYPPGEGHIRVDDRVVDGASVQAYRNLFSTVFSDCHLFSKLYGVTQPSQAVIGAWLDRLGLRGKTRIADGAFSTVALSSGQRKRIAFLVAMLEERPIVVLDEWAADQDPEYRRIFYLELLPKLKQMGKTVIAITHDDRYFDCADRVLKLDSGEVISDRMIVEHA